MTSDDNADTALILMRANGACLALAAYRNMSLNEICSLGHDGIDQIADLATEISYSAGKIADCLAPHDAVERKQLQRLATLYGDRDLDDSLTARCLWAYVVQQVPQLHARIDARLKAIDDGSDIDEVRRETAHIRLDGAGFVAKLSDDQRIERGTLNESAVALHAAGITAETAHCGDWRDGAQILAAGQQIALKAELRRLAASAAER